MYRVKCYTWGNKRHLNQLKKKGLRKKKIRQQGPMELFYDIFEVTVVSRIVEPISKSNRLGKENKQNFAGRAKHYNNEK